MTNDNCDKICWFAMSAPFCKELKAKELLELEQIESFIPMHYVLKSTKQGKVRKLKPVIHNLIFVRTTRRKIQETKKTITCLQYLTRKEGGLNIPIVVPDGQMQQFIAVCETLNEDLKFYRVDEIDLKKGQRVRIIGGMFDQVEGVFVKVKGMRRKRVVVKVDFVTAVVLTELEPEFIQVVHPE